jgi:hypothetical protein
MTLINIRKAQLLALGVGHKDQVIEPEKRNCGFKRLRDTTVQQE